MNTRKAHGPAIRAIRKALGVRQDELAIAADMSPSHLHRIETGERQPSEAALSLICLRLGINKDDVTYTVAARELVAA